MSILQMFLSIPTQPRNLSSVRVLTGPDNLCLVSRISHLSIHRVSFPSTTTTIRMGGGPRTFPGGVSKWQWKRMQAKKAKQLLKARLCRERQIYEMRKRAELKAAISELERPWEVVERAPTLFSIGADEQLKVLADRFQRPGGYDLWSDKDGPQLFKTVDGLPSARFFPKGVVHSVRPYGIIADSSNYGEDVNELNFSGPPVVEAGNGGSQMVRGTNRPRKTKRFSNRRGRNVSDSEADLVPRTNPIGEISSYSKNSRVSSDREKRVAEESNIEKSKQMPRDFYGSRAGQGSLHGSLRDKGSNRSSGSGHAFDAKERREIPVVHNGRYNSGARQFNIGKGTRKPKVKISKDVYDMSMQQDGSYRFQTNR